MRSEGGARHLLPSSLWDRAPKDCTKGYHKCYDWVQVQALSLCITTHTESFQRANSLRASESTSPKFSVIKKYS